MKFLVFDLRQYQLAVKTGLLDQKYGGTVRLMGPVTPLEAGTKSSIWVSCESPISLYSFCPGMGWKATPRN